MSAAAAPKTAGKKTGGVQKGVAPKAKDASQLLGIEAKKEENFGDWYTQVITRSEMLEYYDVSGCYIIRPWAFRQWECIQTHFDSAIKNSGVQNAYFPIFVSSAALKKEEDAFQGFEAEVAWVTRSGKSELSEPIAVRPTSETVMYPAFKNWIRSHRDLPLRLNQWCNVVRWEFKHPVPFIRTREFLWQEGHSAFGNLPDSEREVREILDLYAEVYEELLAVPVVRGRKTEREKFAGALYTTTVEAFVPANGRSVQAATSHCLGQSFAKVFGVEVENERHEKQYVWQNSWGMTTRTLGVCTMVHGDNKGLVIPPRVAPVQVVVVPIKYKDTWEVVREEGTRMFNAVKGSGIRAHLDVSENTSGWKFNHWEVKGVPIRVEIGPKDVERCVAVVVRRDNGAKETVEWTGLCARLQELLEVIQREMLERARRQRQEQTAVVREWKEFVPALDRKCACMCCWCNETPCEEDVKARSAKESEERATAAAQKQEEDQLQLTGAAKSLCIPFEQPELPADAKCFACGKPAKCWALFGRSY